MMRIADAALFRAHEARRLSESRSLRWAHHVVLPILVFGSMGAITWAVRGTSGWGGMDGTIVPGMTWGLLWYYFCARRGIDARPIALWLGLGIALGGDLGYGQYVSWIRGEFTYSDQILAIAPARGYFWFVLAGIGWGAPGGVFLGWALRGRATLGQWVARLGVPLIAVALAWTLVQAFPSLFFPYYEHGLYTQPLDDHLARTVYTNTQNATAVAWWLGVLAVAALQRDRTTLIAGLLIGGGFGIGFAVAAVWCLGYVYAPNAIDWWKVWELHSGFNLGILYVIALNWSVARLARTAPPEPLPLSKASERWRELALVATGAILAYVSCRGTSYTAGAMIGLYDLDDVGQYDWPWARTVLLAPFLAVIVLSVLRRTVRIVRMRGHHFDVPVSHTLLPERMMDMMTALAIVGAITIWPAKIGALYAMFLALAIFALNRLHRYWALIDRNVSLSRPEGEESAAPSGP